MNPRRFTLSPQCADSMLRGAMGGAGGGSEAGLGETDGETAWGEKLSYEADPERHDGGHF